MYKAKASVYTRSFIKRLRVSVEFSSFILFPYLLVKEGYAPPSCFEFILVDLAIFGEVQVPVHNQYLVQESA